MNKKLLIIILIILIIINLSAFATLAYKRYCSSHNTCPHNQGNTYTKTTLLCQELSLSREQIIKIRSLSQSFHSKADSLYLLLNQKRSKLLQLLEAQPIDTAKIDITLAEFKELQAELQKNVIYYLLKEKQLLNEQQQEEFFKIIRSKLVKQRDYYQTGGLDFVENSCDSNCQKTDSCPNIH